MYHHSQIVPDYFIWYLPLALDFKKKCNLAVRSQEFIVHICKHITKKFNLKEHEGIYQYILSIKGI